MCDMVMIRFHANQAGVLRSGGGQQAKARDQQEKKKETAHKFSCESVPSGYSYFHGKIPVIKLATGAFSSLVVASHL